MSYTCAYFTLGTSPAKISLGPPSWPTIVCPKHGSSTKFLAPTDVNDYHRKNSVTVNSSLSSIPSWSVTLNSKLFQAFSQVIYSWTTLVSLDHQAKIHSLVLSYETLHHIWLIFRFYNLWQLSCRSSPAEAPLVRKGLLFMESQWRNSQVKAIQGNLQSILGTYHKMQSNKELLFGLPLPSVSAKFQIFRSS